jgi:hypothetical protein
MQVRRDIIKYNTAGRIRFDTPANTQDKTTCDTQNFSLFDCFSTCRWIDPHQLNGFTKRSFEERLAVKYIRIEGDFMQGWPIV